MNRNEQVGAGFVGQGRAVAEMDEIIPRAREDRVYAAPLEFALEPERDLQREVLFQQRRASLGAGIVTAMAGVDDDHGMAGSGVVRRLPRAVSARRAHDAR